MAKQGVVVIELSEEMNENIMFPPTQDVYRGEWDRLRLPANSTSIHEHLLSLPGLPGVRIELDVDAKRGRVFDPLLLSDAKFKVIREKWEKWAATRSMATPNAGPVEYQKEIVIESMNPSRMATWLHWMKELVSRKKAKLIAGSLDRKLDGRIRVGWETGGGPVTPIWKDQCDRMKAGKTWDEVRREDLAKTEAATPIPAGTGG